MECWRASNINSLTNSAKKYESKLAVSLFQHARQVYGTHRVAFIQETPSDKEGSQRPLSTAEDNEKIAVCQRSNQYRYTVQAFGCGIGTHCAKVTDCYDAFAFDAGEIVTRCETCNILVAHLCRSGYPLLPVEDVDLSKTLCHSICIVWNVTHIVNGPWNFSRKLIIDLIKKDVFQSRSKLHFKRRGRFSTFPSLSISSRKESAKTEKVFVSIFHFSVHAPVTRFARILCSSVKALLFEDLDLT